MLILLGCFALQTRSNQNNQWIPKIRPVDKEVRAKIGSSHATYGLGVTKLLGKT